MAEPLQVQRDMTPVTITLDRKRPYHIGDDERNVVWVGPGIVEVPRWVAEHWGAVEMLPSAESTPPVPDVPAGAVSAMVETVQELPDLPPAPKTAPVPRGRPPKTQREGQ